MKLKRDVIIQLLNDAILMATDRHAEKAAGQLLAYKTHLEMFYKSTDSLAVAEHIANLLILMSDEGGINEV